MSWKKNNRRKKCRRNDARIRITGIREEGIPDEIYWDDWNDWRDGMRDIHNVCDSKQTVKRNKELRRSKRMPLRKVGLDGLLK